MWVRESELIEVVDVGNSKVKRSDENDLAGRKSGHDVEWDDQRSPDEFFADRAGDKVPVANPATQDLADMCSSHPILPSAFHYARFEQRTGE